MQLETINRLYIELSRPWVASNQYGMHFILSQDNEILWRADWVPMEMLRAMVKAANEVQAENAKSSE